MTASKKGRKPATKKADLELLVLGLAVHLSKKRGFVWSTADRRAFNMLWRAVKPASKK